MAVIGLRDAALVSAACLILGCIESKPATSVDARILISDRSVGPVAAHSQRATLSRFARIVRDTVEEGMEAIPESIVVLAFRGDTIRAAIDSGRVYRLSVVSPRFRTADSLGPGVPLARLLQKPGVYAIAGEGAVFVRLPARCGISFHLSDSGALGDGPDSVGIAQLRTLPATTIVDEALVFGCPQSRPIAPHT